MGMCVIKWPLKYQDFGDQWCSQGSDDGGPFKSNPASD